MRISRFRSVLAIAALAGVAACGGGGASAPSFVPPDQPRQQPGPDSILSSIVGVGDSLTAGYQSNGFLGATGVNAGGLPVPPNQENGWWSLLYEQASGKPIDTAVTQMYDPSTSPLPLIKGPGLNNQIINANNGFFPITQAKTGDVCTDNNGFNNAGYHLKGLTQVRMNPTFNERPQSRRSGADAARGKRPARAADRHLQRTARNSGIAQHGRRR